MTDVEALVERAQRTHVVVIGGGMAGLVAALQCAKVGFRVTVLEARDVIGGGIARAELDGLVLDVGADSFSPGLGSLIDELGLREQVEQALPGSRWVAAAKTAGPLPDDAILGIPANPWAPEVRRLIGWSGAWRAYLDRLRPPLTIGHERRLGTLVRTRMGARVADRLVAPVSIGVFGVEPDRVDVDVAAPGLNRALTRVGSLAGAVAHELPERREPSQTLTGGMGVLIEALRARLTDLGAQIRTASPVGTIARTPSGWAVTTVVAAPSPTDDSNAATTSPADAGEAGRFDANAVIVCTGETTARALLAPSVPGVADGILSSPPAIDSVTLVVDAPTLDDAPRGHAVYPIPGTATALAVLHATATWRWLAAAAGRGRHVVRVDLPAGCADPVGTAVREATTLLGVPIGRVRASHVEARERALPACVIGDPAAPVRAAVAAAPGLGIAGAWVNGSGLAAVSAGAAAESDRVRHATLWGEGWMSGKAYRDTLDGPTSDVPTLDERDEV